MDAGVRSAGSSVSMPVVDIGVVRMGMFQGLVPVPVGVRLAGRIVRTMFVLMVNVVMMPVPMFQWLVNVVVRMGLGQMDPETDGHERGGAEDQGREGLAPENQPGGRADERGE